MDNKNLSTQFDLHSRLFNNVLEDIDYTHATSRLNPEVNHMSWIAGHILSTRHTMANILGVHEPEKYASLFANRKGYDENEQYPELTDIKKEWDNITGKIHARFASVTPEVLSAPSPSPIPVADQTIGGLFSFLMSHESYHIGQLGLLRKYQGYGAMSYK